MRTLQEFFSSRTTVQTYHVCSHLVTYMLLRFMSTFAVTYVKPDYSYITSVRNSISFLYLQVFNPSTRMQSNFLLLLLLLPLPWNAWYFAKSRCVPANDRWIWPEELMNKFNVGT